jgi:hypothetical protein
MTVAAPASPVTLQLKGQERIARDLTRLLERK